MNNQRENYEFKFNGVIGPDAKQDEVFERVASKVVLGALDGFNGTVFAYGQTGSGKTFTITGGAERYVDRGIIPRAISRIYGEIAKRADASYEVHVSYVEIYNDQGYDLLDPDHETKALEDLPKVALQETEEGKVHLRNLSYHRAASEEEALNLLFLGDTNRAITETPMNMASSRSHCIFTMNIERRESGSDTVRKAKVNIVDLAGSERVSKTGVNGQILQEAKYINLSLHFLEQVVIALQERAMGMSRPHIPYRNAMMTMMLKDSLGGNCKTVMVATASCEKDHLDESISTCRFAQRIAMVSNVVGINEEVDPTLIIKRLKAENRELKDELKLLRGENDDRGDLTESEIERLRGQVKAYCQARGPEAELDVGASMLKVKAALKIFREIVLQGGGGVLQGDGGGAARGKPAAAWGEAETESKGGGIGSEDLKAEIKRLALQVKQRDNEINILVSMLQKGEGGTKGAQRATAAFPLVNTSDPGSTLQALETQRADNGVGPRSDAVSSSSAPDVPEPPMDMMALLADRNKAFEHFRRSYRRNEAIEENKALLKEKYGRAKALGERVNAARAKINQLKATIEQRRVAQSMAEQEGRPIDEFVAEEERCKLAIDREKGDYRDAFNELRDLKKEIEHLQMLLEQSRKRLQTDFEQWLLLMLKQQANGGGVGAGPGGARSTQHSAAAAQRAEAAERRRREAADAASRVAAASANHATNGMDSSHVAATWQPGDPPRTMNAWGGGDDGTDERSPSRSTAYYQQAAEVVVHSPLAGRPALTGNAQADADIQAFYAAREKLLKARGVAH